MAVGMPGADSSNLVTSQIGGQNLIDLATNSSSGSRETACSTG
jgi:hypothetical protein